MVEQAEQEAKPVEKGGQGFNYVPQQEFPEVGDQYDRDVSYAGTNPSQRNTGWYDFTPTQRYVAIITSWAAVSESIVNGTIGQIDDETILIAAYAPFDIAAMEAGEELAQSDQFELLGSINNVLYGDGFIIDDSFVAYDIPRIDVNDPEATFDALYAALGGQPMDRATSVMSGQANAPFGMVMSIPPSPIANAVGDPYEAGRQGYFMGEMYDKIGGALDPDGNIDAATAADLYSHVNKFSHDEGGGRGAVLQNGVDWVAPKLYDAMYTDLAIGGVVGTLGVTGRALAQTIPGGKPIAAAIVGGLRTIKKYTGFGSDVGKHYRRGAQAIGGAIAGSAIAGSVITASLETNEEALNSLLRSTDSKESRDLLRMIYAESQHPISYALRSDPDGWFQNKDERRNMSLDDMRVENAKSRYGSDQQYQPGPEVLRQGYSFFNPEVRKARKDTSLEEIQSGESYNLNMYHENGRWDLR